MQESEAARQEAAADLQRCYEEAALLQAQLSSLAASCREGADCRVQRLIAQLQQCSDGLRQIHACAQEAMLEESDNPSDDGTVKDRSPLTVARADSQQFLINCGEAQIWVRPEEDGNSTLASAVEAVTALAELAKRAKREEIRQRERAGAAEVQRLLTFRHRCDKNNRSVSVHAAAHLWS